MKYTYIFILLVFCLSQKLPAQNWDKKNLIYLELGGNAGAYSLNYDLTFYNNFSARAGMMLLPSNPGTIKAFPLLLNYRVYIRNKFLEFGLGETFFSAPLDFGRLGNFTGNSSLLTGVIAFGVQGIQGNNFRFAFTPFYYNKQFIPFVGVSFGYSF